VREATSWLLHTPETRTASMMHKLGSTRCYSLQPCCRFTEVSKNLLKGFYVASYSKPFMLLCHGCFSLLCKAMHALPCHACPTLPCMPYLASAWKECVRRKRGQTSADSSCNPLQQEKLGSIANRRFWCQHSQQRAWYTYMQDAPY
jgi:hypothetical protein